MTELRRPFPADGSGVRRRGRLTISDVAREAGVSIGAVSNAVNGRPGVSEATRARVLEVAERLGWTPSQTARSLMSSRTATVELVLAQDPRALDGNAYFAGFLAGAQLELATAGYSLLLEVDPQMEGDADAHRRWLDGRHTDGLLLFDLRVDDARIGLLSGRARVPVVASGQYRVPDGLASVWVDEDAAMREAIGYLAGLGHRRVARISGPADRLGSAVRDGAFMDAAHEFELHPTLVPADPSGGGPGGATRRLLSSRTRPTAVLYDDELGVIAGLGVAMEMGLTVPRDLSLVGWYDSPVSTMTFPSITAVGYDTQAVGVAAARLLLGMLRGEEPASVLAAVPTLRVRASTAPPPAR